MAGVRSSAWAINQVASRQSPFGKIMRYTNLHTYLLIICIRHCCTIGIELEITQDGRKDGRGDIDDGCSPIILEWRPMPKSGLIKSTWLKKVASYLFKRGAKRPRMIEQWVVIMRRCIN